MKGWGNSHGVGSVSRFSRNRWTCHFNFYLLFPNALSILQLEGGIVFHVWNVSLIIDTSHTYLQWGACILSCTVLLPAFPPKSHIRCISYQEIKLVSIIPIWFLLPQGKELSPHIYFKTCHLKFVLLPWSLEWNGLSWFLKQFTKETKVESITCITSGKKNDLKRNHLNSGLPLAHKEDSLELLL